MSLFDDVGAFHHKFEIPREMWPPRAPHLLSKADYDFRLKFLREELGEFIKAHEKGDLVEAFDGLLDLVYVALGTAHMMALPWNEGWAEVQATNMAKERVASADKSKRGSAWDVVKPAGWKRPDLKSILRRCGWK